MAVLRGGLPCPCFASVSVSVSVLSLCAGLCLRSAWSSFSRTAVGSCPATLLSLGAGPADAQAGPRIFVGKLNKDTTEADVRDHFTRFG